MSRRENISKAQRELGRLKHSDAARAPLEERLRKAKDGFEEGMLSYEGSAKTRGKNRFKEGLSDGCWAKRDQGNEYIYKLAKATRAFIRTQVWAQYVYDALVPPAKSPEDLGLDPFVWPTLNP